MEPGKRLLWFMILLLMGMVSLSLILQSFAAKTNSQLRAKNVESMNLDRELAEAKNQFSALVHIDVLRSAGAEIFPKHKTIKFGGKVGAGEL
ncbi:MAG: hypothetical protein LBB23_04230 [Rickettsiales bacterium]|jgi:hypothetical protein|nr:hypothetical protein [Rickettsiales bacterium]